MKNSYIKLLDVCDAADDFIKEFHSGLYDSTTSDDFQKERILICLIHLEAVLDKGRSITYLDDKTIPDARLLVNERMDAIRREIHTIMDSFTPEAFKNIVESIGLSIKQRLFMQ